MQSATIASRTLEIDGMSGDACVQKVTGALKGLQGVTTESVKVGQATIGADPAGCNTACAAIEKAGYKAHEKTRTGEASGSTYAAPKTLSGDKSGNQSPALAQNQTSDKADTANRGGGPNEAQRPNVIVPPKPAPAKI